MKFIERKIIALGFLIVLSLVIFFCVSHYNARQEQYQFNEQLETLIKNSSSSSENLRTFLDHSNPKHIKESIEARTKDKTTKIGFAFSLLAGRVFNQENDKLKILLEHNFGLKLTPAELSGLLASATGNVEIQKLLVANGAKPNNPISEEYFAYPLLLAIECLPYSNNNLAIPQKEKQKATNIRLFSKNSSDDDIYARRSRNPDDIIASIKYLISIGADVNFGSRDERVKGIYTPIMAACDRGRLDIIKILLEAGADPNIDFNNEKLLDFCVKSNRFCSEGEKVLAIKLLKEKGAVHSKSYLEENTIQKVK